MYCKKCGNNIEAVAKFCGKCGLKNTDTNSEIERTEVVKDNNSSILEEKIKKLGRFSKAIGWINIVINILVFIWSISDINFSDSGLADGGVVGLLIACGAGAVFITLGKQIEQLKNIKQNMWILLGLSVLMIIIAGATGGTAGILLIIFIGYLIWGLVKAYKLAKIK